MIYTLTDKLAFADNPVIEIKDKKIAVKSDAVTVLKLMDFIQKNNTMEAALQAAEILFSEKDRKTLESLKLSFPDYVTVLTTAMTLATGGDPDDESGEE